MSNNRELETLYNGAILLGYAENPNNFNYDVDIINKMRRIQDEKVTYLEVWRMNEYLIQEIFKLKQLIAEMNN
jgi:hypothetical protein